MLRRIEPMYGFTVEGTDEEVGFVQDFYFDAETWELRYVVVETGSWLAGKRVLVAPKSLQRPDWDGERLPVSLTRKQVEDSPDVDLTKSVSAEQLEHLHAYYGWPWWGGPLLQTGPTHLPILMPLEPTTEEQEEAAEIDEESRLHSTRAVTGFHIHAKDGDVGHCTDFFINTANWIFHYIVVDAGTWLSSREVLVSTDWIEEIRWSDREIQVDVEKEEVREGPEYDFEGTMDREYEEVLHQHYRRKGYWQRIGH